MNADSRYVLYFRVSTKKQGESGLGLEAQRAYIQHFYRDKPILAEFTDVRSGKTIHKRPELQKAIALCKKERATLVVAKIDRLSRNTENALHIYKELGERLESCDIPNLDKFTLTLFMAIADRERVLISIRTRQALEARRVRVGEWRVGGPNARKAAAGLLGSQLAKEMAEDNENSRRASALISMLRSDGKTYEEIAQQLNVAGFKTPRGSDFHKMQVQRLYKRILASKAVE
ncbi:recombinase family protein [Spirosoma agri]|uniref:Recombinase family protein n=1 Tax=Spirosoma agri TaxID=1987381 RepID=A0A6M0IR87_9BACT|nr:recombinase family protein [Spirosoma agri]NEU70839.1 recombinase family protein [Spirosoma agri]